MGMPWTNGKGVIYLNGLRLSDEEFLKVFRSKDYYSFRDSGYNRNAAMLRQVERMKVKAEEILARLEEL